MRISDWSSDVCSSDLAPHYHDVARLHRWHDTALHCFRCRCGEPNRGWDRCCRRNAGCHCARNFLHSALLSVDTPLAQRSEEHTSELQSLMRISYAVFCLKKKKKQKLYTNSTLSS